MNFKFFYKNFLLYIKMSEKTQNSLQYIRYKDIVLQRAKEYYEKKKKKEKNMQEIDIKT